MSMQKICFVCTGNTCRPPVAEKLLTKYLKKANLDIKVCSYGLAVNKGDNINPHSASVLKDYGINVRSKKAKQITKSAYKKCNLFITMTKNQKQYFPQCVEVFSFGEIVGGEDIVDPYGQDLFVYQQMAKQIDEYCKILVQKLINIKGER